MVPVPCSKECTRTNRLEVYTFKATPFRNYGFFLEKTTRILEKFYLNFHQNEEGDAVPRGCK